MFAVTWPIDGKRANRRIGEHGNRGQKGPRIASMEQIKSYIAMARLLGLTGAARTASAAQARHESRRLHYTLDYPGLAAEAVDTVLVP